MSISRQARITPSSQHVLQKTDVHVRQSNVDLAELKTAAKNNGRDELILQRDGDLFVVDAPRLVFAASGPPALGDSFRLGGLEGEVVHVDQDKQRSGVAGGTFLAGVLGTLTATSAFAGSLGSEPLAATLVATMLGATALASQVLSHRPADDSALAQVTTTLAHSNTGSLSEVEEQLKAKGPVGI